MPAYLYPVALDVSGRKCVVVGGGSVGARKILALLEAGALITLVCLAVRDTGLRELIAEGRVNYINAMFTPSHLDKAFLAIAATDRVDVNAAVAECARARGVLLNLAAPSGDGSEGDFATMATVRRSELLIAVTTGGAGPAISARIKREIESLFGPEWTPYVTLLREMRDSAKERFPAERERTEAMRRLADRTAVRELLAAGDEAGARQEALSCLS